MNRWRYLAGALDTREAYVANITQAVRPLSTVPWEQIANGRTLFPTPRPVRLQAILPGGEAPALTMRLK